MPGDRNDGRDRQYRYRREEDEAYPPVDVPRPQDLEEEQAYVDHDDDVLDGCEGVERRSEPVREAEERPAGVEVRTDEDEFVSTVRHARQQHDDWKREEEGATSAGEPVPSTCVVNGESEDADENES